jgi:hypothetical protein
MTRITKFIFAIALTVALGLTVASIVRGLPLDEYQLHEAWYWKISWWALNSFLAALFIVWTVKCAYWAARIYNNDPKNSIERVFSKERK